MLSLLVSAALAAPLGDRPAALSADLARLQATAPPDADLVQVVVVPVDGVDADKLGLAIAEALPATRQELVAGGLVQTLVPVALLDEVAETPGVRRVRRPHRARPKGEITEGIEVFFAQDWHAMGLTGRGVRVAVLDVGFTYYQDLLGSELPASVDTYFFGDWDGTEHGTAVAEIIHDIAPDAELALYSFETEVEFYEACQAVLDNGEYLVNASIGFDNVWHADGTSGFADAVDVLTDSGVTWMAAAGNEDDNYWVGTLTDDDADGFLEMDGEELLPVYVGDGYSGASVRWDEPFGAAAVDIDIVVLDETAGYELAVGEEIQDGSGDPYEWAQAETDDDYVYIGLTDYSEGEAVGLKAWIYGDWELGDGWKTSTESLTLPADAEGAFAVAAVEFWTGEAASYSSRGPTNDGRQKPDIAAPTGVTTWSYGETGFDGTSAAAPHATGLAALILQADGDLTPAGLKQFLVDTAVDLGDAGADDTYGCGHIYADDPPAGFEPDADTDVDSDTDTDTDADADWDTGWDSGGWGPPADDDDEESKGGCTSAPLAPGLVALGLAVVGLGRRRRRG